MDITREQRRSPYNGYFRQSAGIEDPELTHVGPGTPCGEYFRRHWLPVCMAAEVSERPAVVRALGEELVAFKDLSGRYGLVHKHCSHRRASLEYGIVAERGIRCCYHGWLFDIDGTILEVPGEPDESPIPQRLCHGAYPVREFAGLLFAYMGPPEHMPEFTLLDTMAQPDNDMVPYAIDYPCNWLQVAENPMDPFHSVFLHTRVTRAHFNPAWGAMPEVEWKPVRDGTGIYLTNTRRWQQYIWVRTAEVYLPALAQPPDIYQNPDREKFFPRVGITKWTVPTDDQSCRIVAWRHFNDTLDLDGKGNRDGVGLNKVDFVGQTGVERSYEEGQLMPSDYEAQVSQGPITIHADEQLGTTDGGVARYRRMLRDAIRGVANGDAPAAPRVNADGNIPTMAGDVIVEVGQSNVDDRALQRRVGQLVGEIVEDTLTMSAAERSQEIEQRVRAAIASGAHETAADSS
jgi:phenylpropionate dioxygenase-like ring-hydroxylating dioxygenase large terminal subunit